MNRLELWILRRVAKKVVIQGDHMRKITQFYGVLIEAAKEEFTEDSKPTLSSFLKDCHRQAISLFL